MTAKTSYPHKPRVLLLLPFMVGVGVVAIAASSMQQPVFRSVVDLIAVDVQVVDPEGNPIEQIGPDHFAVSINGQRRKVVSAEFIRQGQGSSLKPNSDPVTAGVVGPDTANSNAGRTFILAIDSGSFEVGYERAAIE